MIGKGADATWYEGHRDGMVFKKGGKGLGYYADVQWKPDERPQSEAVLCSEFPPAVLKLAEWFPAPSCSGPVEIQAGRCSVVALARTGTGKRDMAEGHRI